MAIAKTLKFIKEDTGNVLLVNTQNNAIVNAFNPAMSLQRDLANENRFRVASSTNEDGFLLNYLSIDCALCEPVIVENNFTQFLKELSTKFFFATNSSTNGNGGSSGNFPPPFGVFEWIGRGSDHSNDYPIANDLFQGFVTPTEFSNTLIWNGIGETNNGNLANFTILSTIQV